MRQNWLITGVFVTGFAFLVFSGCQKQAQVVQESEIAPETPNQQKVKYNTPPPEINFEITDVNFGQVGPGALLTSEVKFKNTGQGVLEITQIKPCCGTVAKQDKEQYAPGESGVINIEYHTKSTIGKIENEIVVHSNDPENPEIILYIRAEIVRIVVWEPQIIKLYLNMENGACPKMIIKSLDNQPFAIRQIKSTENLITADYNATVEQKEFVLNLKVDMEKLNDKTSGNLKITMSHPQGSIAEVPFKVEPKFGLTPNPLIVSNLKENQPKREKIKILNNYTEDLEIESTSSSKNTVKMIDYTKVENGYELNIEITPIPITKGEIRVIDTFYINIKGEKPLELDCFEYYLK